MANPPKLEAWQVEDAARLKQLFDNRKKKLSQLEFGDQFSIGSQGMVWQYLAGRRPLNLKAAINFARGLNVKLDEISPTLAKVAMDAAREVTDDYISSHTSSDASSPQPPPERQRNEPKLQWVYPDEQDLLSEYRAKSDDNKAALLTAARALPNEDFVGLTAHKA